MQYDLSLTSTQVKNNIYAVPSLGLQNGEACEQVFAQLNRWAKPLRSSSVASKLRLRKLSFKNVRLSFALLKMFTVNPFSSGWFLSVLVACKEINRAKERQLPQLMAEKQNRIIRQRQSLLQRLEAVSAQPGEDITKVELLALAGNFESFMRNM
jgi:hypothetical protein